MVAGTELRVVGQVVIEWRASVVVGTEWRVVGQVVIECWALGRAVTVERVEWWAVRGDCVEGWAVWAVFLGRPGLFPVEGGA